MTLPTKLDSNQLKTLGRAKDEMAAFLAADAAQAAIDARQGIADAASAFTFAGTKNKTYYQTTQPSSGMTAGDLWFDTDDNYKSYRYDGAAWQPVRDTAPHTFFQTSAPTATQVGDIWFDTDDGMAQYRWSGSAWVSVQDGDIATAQATADGKNKTFYQTSAPTASAVGDLWFDTDDNWKPYRWSGSAWDLIHDASPIPGTEIQAGAITTNHMTANTIDGNRITAGTLDAGKITAGTIQTDRMTANTINGDRITGNTLNANKIVAGTVSANELATDSVIAAKIQAGAVVADKIAAGAVTAKALTIANFDNLWPNPGSEDAVPSGYTAPGNGTDPQYDFLFADSSLSGSFVRKLSVAGAGAGPTLKNIVPCNPGDKFYVEAMAKRASGTDAVATVGVRFLDVTKTGIGSTLVSSSTVNSGTWTKYSATSGAAPSNACFVQFELALGTATAALDVRFDNILARQMAEGKVIVDGSITASKIAADELKTTNFASTGTGASEVATAGAKMQNAVGGLALIVGPQGMKIGAYLMDEAQGALFKAIGRQTSGTGASLSVDRVWYRGNDDTGTLGGAPNISRLQVTSLWWNTDASIGSYELHFALSPNAASDNLDGMRYATIELWNQSSRTSGTLTLITSFKCLVPDRLYKVPGTDTDAGNSSAWSVIQVHSGVKTANFGALKVTLYNVHGPSDTHCFYCPSGWTNGSALTDNGTTWPGFLTGGTGGGSGGGGGAGGGCLDPRTPVLTGPRTLAPLHTVRVGDKVWTRPEAGGDMAYHVVEGVRHTSNLRCRVKMQDGRAFVCSVNHLMNVRGVWRRADSLQAGEELQGAPSGHVRSVTYLGEGPVVQLSIPTARTYFAGNGCWHHNTLKP